MPGFELFTKGRALSVKLPFGVNGARVVSGGAVIGTVRRPRRKALTEYVDDEPITMTVDYHMSDWETMKGSEIERRLKIIGKMRGLADDDEPPEIIILGDPRGCVPHDYTDAPKRRWWVIDHQEEEGAQRNDFGNRIDVRGVITIQEIVEDKVLNKLPKAKKKKKKKGKPKKYTVKKGDTLSGIAAKFKIEGGWKKLAKLNNIRDPKSIKKGQVLRLDD